MSDTLMADLYRAMMDDAPKGEIPGWLPARRWVLSTETMRILAERSGIDPDCQTGYLLGLPYRVDPTTVKGYTLEAVKARAKR